MNIKSSLNIGKISGINVKLHWSFSLLILWIFTSSLRSGGSIGDGIHQILFVFAIFGCVVLHELGHALTARKFGYETKQIVLSPIGGMAQMKQLPQKPLEELLVAIAGPLVSFALAMFFYVAFGVFGSEVISQETHSLDKVLDSNFLFNLFVINLILAIFNLIPAFPMDGGRIFRAALSMKLTRASATKIAANVGQIIAIIFIIVGVKHNPFLVLIGIFIFMAARTEETYERSRSILSDFKVKNLIMTKYTVFDHNDHIDKVVAVILASQEKEFVVVHNQEVVGVLTQNNVIQALSLKENFCLHEIMNKKFPSFSPNMNLKSAYEVLVTNQYSVGPVIENSKLVGILNMENIQEFLLFNKI